MEHKKTYNIIEYDTPNGHLIIEGPISTNRLKAYKFHPKLVSFRRPEDQYQALITISQFQEGRIIVAVNNDTIIGYVTFVYPDPIERWSEGNMENLIELGAIEVIPDFRGNSVGKNLLKVSMMDDNMENYIIISTEYYWHWDLKGTGLDVWKYKRLMEKMMSVGGLTCFSTDEPEISSHPANCLMARIGKRVSQESIEQFNSLRFKNKYTI